MVALPAQSCRVPESILSSGRGSSVLRFSCLIVGLIILRCEHVCEWCSDELLFHSRCIHTLHTCSLIGDQSKVTMNELKNE